jgi:hypothetical protein
MFFFHLFYKIGEQEVCVTGLWSEVAGKGDRRINTNNV